MLELKISDEKLEGISIFCRPKLESLHLRDKIRDFFFSIEYCSLVFRKMHSFELIIWGLLPLDLIDSFVADDVIFYFMA